MSRDPNRFPDGPVRGAADAWLHTAAYRRGVARAKADIASAEQDERDADERRDLA